MPVFFVSCDCWGSLFLNPGLEPPAVDQIERDQSRHRGGVICGGGQRGDVGIERIRAKNPGSNLSCTT